jgi:histidine triad (HIT) family protein
LVSLNDAEDDDAALLGKILLVTKRLAGEYGLSSGYRVVINNGAEAGQSVDHLHVHVLGGRAMRWPPG